MRAPQVGLRRAAFGALAALLFACAGPPAGPPQVRWGVDECSHCHMILAEERFAAVARDAAGGEARFDDLRCALAFLAERDAAGWTVWVHDSAGPGWLPAAAASFAATATRTPMGSGLLAFATPQAARAAAAGAAPLGWDALRSRPADATVGHPGADGTAPTDGLLPPADGAPATTSADAPPDRATRQ